MKKVVCFLFIVLLIATMSLNAFAATGINEYEQKVLDKLNACYISGEGGWEFSVSPEYINSSRNYFAGECDLTEEQMNTLFAYIDQGMAVIKKEGDAQGTEDGSFELSEMSQSAREEVLALGKEACAEVELKMNYDAKDNQVVITPTQSKNPIFESSPIIKTTGEDFPVTGGTVITAVVAVLSIGVVALFVVSKRNGLFSV